MAWIKNLSKRQKLYAVAIVVLVAFYGFMYMPSAGVTLPTNSRIERERQKIRQLRQELTNFEKSQEKRAENKERIKSLTRGFWPSDGKIPTNQIQLKIERLGRRSGVTLKTVGAPKSVDISENINAVDITVSSTTSIKDFGKFMREIENHRPRLIWNNCVIRPNRLKSPTAINVSGKVRAYVLTKAATAYLEEAQM